MTLPTPSSLLDDERDWKLNRTRLKMAPPRLTRSQRRRSGARSHRRRWLRVKRDTGNRVRYNCTCTREEGADVRSTGFSRNPGEEPPQGGITNGAFQPGQYLLRAVEVVTIHSNPKRQRGNDLATSLTLRVSVSRSRGQYNCGVALRESSATFAERKATMRHFLTCRSQSPIPNPKSLLPNPSLPPAHGRRAGLLENRHQARIHPLGRILGQGAFPARPAHWAA